ncbi:PrgI family protein [Dorea longicatena]|nr:PrgI family protein [Dorea longicatena]
MVTVMLPFFFMAMYEKDGLPFEKVVANMIRQKFICPAVRPYKTENFYQEISTLVKKEGVPDGKKDKAGGSAGASVPGGKKKPSGKKKQKKQKRKRTGKA